MASSLGGVVNTLPASENVDEMGKTTRTLLYLKQRYWIKEVRTKPCPSTVSRLAGLASWEKTSRTNSLEKTDAGKDWGQEEKGVTGDEMVGWHHRVNGHEFEQTPGDSKGQGSLACCSPWGCKGLDMTLRLNNNNREHSATPFLPQAPV